MKKWKIWIAILVILIGGWLFFRKSGNTTEKTQDKKVEQVTAEVSDIRLKISATGTVNSNFDVDIKCKSSGQIIKLPFDISDPVKKNDLIAELDPVDEQRNVDMSKLSLTTAQAGRDKAQASLRNLMIEQDAVKKGLGPKIKAAMVAKENSEKKYGREKALFEQKLISTQELEDSLADLETARNSLSQVQMDDLRLAKMDNDYLTASAEVRLAEVKVKSAQLDLDNAQRRLDETKVYSPIDGFVSDKLVQVGNIVASGTSNVSGGTKLFTISDCSKMFVMVYVDEADIAGVSVGNRAQMTFDAFPNKRFRGEVIRVAISGSTTSNITTFSVLLQVTDKDFALLKPGMSASVDIITSEKKDALVVPIGAVFEDRNGYYVKTPGNPHLPVKLGLKTFDKIEILEGLKDGDKVISETSAKNQFSNNGQNQRRGGPPMMH
ncbi:MAG: efflux RND transporter periplasmic adaptor subunit [Candidatus Wallbacteria bacterium]|nr:efflux RND transporter periplasmic adaptor subunit [Candidatus Wallbacteria bacterium]